MQVELSDGIVSLRGGSTSDELEKELCRSLEFNDVIKQELMKLNEKLSRRELYNKIAEVVKNSPNVSELSAVCARVLGM